MSSVSLNRSFLLAAAQGNVPEMERCIKESDGACAEARDEDNSLWRQFDKDLSDFRSTALHLACLTNQEKSIQFLCERFPKMVKSVDRLGEVPFFSLAQGHKKISMIALNALITAGADFSKTQFSNNSSENGLQVLTQYADAEYFKRALETIPCCFQLKAQLDLHFPAVLSHLINSHIECEREKALNYRSCFGTPMYHALMFENLEVVELLRKEPHVDLSLSIDLTSSKSRIPLKGTLAEAADLLLKRENKSAIVEEKTTVPSSIVSSKSNENDDRKG